MSNLNFTIDNGVITINNRIIDLPYPAVEALDVGELIIVRVEPTVGEIFNTNVYGFTADCNCKWKIEESPHGTEDDKPFTSISISPDSQLVAGNWNGVNYVVDLSNGTISTIAFDK